jgi:hypothetical protein
LDELSNLVAAYFRYQATQAESDAWAWDQVNVLGFERPAHKWDQLLALLAVAPDETQIALIGAGPLEDLLRYCAANVVDLLASEVHGNSRLRAALGHVWLQEPHASDVNDARRRIEQLLGSLDLHS